MGLRPPMYSQIFYPTNFNANPLNILVHLQLRWLHNDYQFKVWICTNCKPTHDFLIPLNTNLCTICHRLAAITISSYDPPTPAFGGRKWYQSYSTSVHTIRLSSTVWPQYTTRQTDRGLAIGCLCHSIGGLINFFWKVTLQLLQLSSSFHLLLLLHFKPF